MCVEGLVQHEVRDENYPSLPSSPSLSFLPSFPLVYFVGDELSSKKTVQHKNQENTGLES